MTEQNNGEKRWMVYILRCRDQSLYTGITIDLERRIAKHNAKEGGAKYTRSRQPVTLVYSEQALSRSLAARRERQIKKMTVAKKNDLIGSCPLSPTEPSASTDSSSESTATY